MSFPFSFEDRIELRIDSPEKAARVAEGIEQWLLKNHARDVKWEGQSLHFQGPHYPRRRGLPHLRNALRSIGPSWIQFQNLPDKVLVNYRISLFPIEIPLLSFGVLVTLVLSGVAGPRMLFLPVALLATYGVAYLCWFVQGRSFKTYFEIAAIRGLADGAAREYEALRSR